MGLFTDLFGDDSKKRKNSLGFFAFLKEMEEEKNKEDLEDWQQDLVNQGNYDSTSFEEEELEDDDYYNDDL